MGIAETYPASTVNEILEVNLKDEKHAVDVYMQIMKKIYEMKDELSVNISNRVQYKTYHE